MPKMTPDRSWQGWISIITATKSKKNVYDNILDPCGDLYIQSEKITDHLTYSAEGKARFRLHRWVRIETLKNVIHCSTCNINLCVFCYCLFHFDGDIAKIEDSVSTTFKRLKIQNKSPNFVLFCDIKLYVTPTQPCWSLWGA